MNFIVIVFYCPILPEDILECFVHCLEIFIKTCTFCTIAFEEMPSKIKVFSFRKHLANIVSTTFRLLSAMSLLSPTLHVPKIPIFTLPYDHCVVKMRLFMKSMIALLLCIVMLVLMVLHRPHLICCVCGQYWCCLSLASRVFNQS